MNKRVVVTGMGAVTPLGNDVESTWNSALQSKSGIDLITLLDTEKHSVKIAGEVKDFSLNEDVLSLRDQSRYDRFILLALKAVDEAMTNSKLKVNENIPAHQLGAILGVGMGGFKTIEDTKVTAYEKGVRRISPFFIPAMIPNMSTGLASIVWGFTGVNYSISSACASSCHAMSAAFQEISSGRSKAMITGGCESTLADLALGGFTNMKALSKRNDEPQKASRPFDKDRTGFIMAEGAGVLILEELEHAKARGAEILAEVSGFGFSSDAHHITAPHPEGAGAILSMKSALKNSNLDAEQIDYINAHGTSTPLGDRGETKAIKNVFGEHAYKLKVSSTKSMTGHMLGGAGGVESIFCVKALQNQIIPPTINLENPDEDCDLDYTPNVPVKTKVEYAMNNSFGFGGTNATLIFKKF